MAEPKDPVADGTDKPVSDEDPNDSLPGGKQGPDKPSISPDAEWGLSENPVRETPTPWSGMTKVGGGT